MRSYQQMRADGVEIVMERLQEQMMHLYIDSIFLISPSLTKFCFANTTHSWHPYSLKTPCFLLHFDYIVATLFIFYSSRLKLFSFWILTATSFFWSIPPTALPIAGLPTFRLQLMLSKLREASLAFSCWPKTTLEVSLYSIVWLFFFRVILLFRIIVIIVILFSLLFLFFPYF